MERPQDEDLQRMHWNPPSLLFNPWDKLYNRWNFNYRESDNFGRFDEFLPENRGLDCTVKSAALKASACVVSLTSYSGIQQLFMCSGIIVNSDGGDGDFSSVILTSATLLRYPTGEDAIADNIKVDVYLVDDSLCEGEIVGYDFHYNIAAILIKSQAVLRTAVIGNIGDSTEAVICSSGSSFQIVPHRDPIVKLYPRMAVIALGRYYDAPYHIMAAPGALCSENCDLDCGELRMTDCKIKKNGIGGALIDYNGCVIGMNFYKRHHTPFLPINIALKCLQHLQKYREVPRPWLGVKTADLDRSGVGELERLSRRFHNPLEGVIVRKVESESPASRAGLHTGDIIFQLDGKPVRSSLEFTCMVLDKAKGPLEVNVNRAGSIGPYTMSLVPQSSTKLNRWPIGMDMS